MLRLCNLVIGESKAFIKIASITIASVSSKTCSNTQESNMQTFVSIVNAVELIVIAAAVVVVAFVGACVLYVETFKSR